MTTRLAQALAAAALVVVMAPAAPLTAARPQAADVSIALKSRAMEPGQLVVVTVTTSMPVDHVTVNVFDRSSPVWRVDESTWRALVGIDLDVKPGTYAIKAVASAADVISHAEQDLVVAPHDFPTRRLTVDDAYVNPPEAVAERIAQDARDLEKIWAESAPERLWKDPFLRPVPQAANSAFGSRSVFNDQKRSPHSGADFLSPAGTPVHAPNAGRVVLARDLYFSGNTVIIDHGLGLFSLIAHLSVIGVHAGEVVTAGHVLGAVGATGRVTGAHLHWAVRVGGARVDPLSVLAVLGKPAA